MTVAEFINKVGFKVNEGDVKKVNSTISSIKSTATKILGVIGIGFSLTQLNSIAEEFDGIGDRLSYATGNAENLNEIQKKILESANNCRSAYGNMVDTVTSLKQANAEVFPIEEGAVFVEYMNKLGKAAGYSDGEISSMGNSIQRIAASGKASSSDLIRMARQTPVLVEKISESLGVSTDELYKMADAGEVTASTIKTALLDSAESIDKAFSNLNFGVSDALLNIRNRFGVWVDETNKMLNLTQSLAKIMVAGFNKIMSVLNRVRNGFVWLSEKVGGTERAMKLLAIVAGSIFAALNADKIMGFLNSVKSVVSGIHSKTSLLVMVVVILALLIEDLFNFMKGNDSLIGTLLEKAGVDADDFREKVAALWEKIKGIIPAIKEFATGIGKQLVEGFKALLPKLIQLGKTLLPTIISLFQRIGSFVGKLGRSIIPVLSEAISGLISFLFELIDAILPVISDLLEEILPLILEVIDEVLPMILDLIQELIPFLTDIIKKILPVIISLIKSLLPVLSKIIKQVLPVVLNLIKELLPPLLDLIRKILPVIVKLIEAIIPIMLQIIDSILPVIINLIDTLMPLLQNIIDSILPIVLQLIESIVPLIAQIAETILPIISQLLEALLPILGEIIEAVLPVVLELIEAILPILTEIIEAVLPVILELIEAILPVITEIVEAVLPVILEVIEALLPLLTEIIDAILPVVLELLDNLMPIVKPIIELVSDLAKTIMPVLIKLLDAIRPILEPLLSILGPIADILGTIIGAIAKVVGWIAEGLGWVIDLVFGTSGSTPTDNSAAAVNNTNPSNLQAPTGYAKGTDYSDENFVAGEEGPELITGQRGRKVFTAVETGEIFKNLSMLASLTDARSATPQTVSTITNSSSTRSVMQNVNINNRFEGEKAAQKQAAKIMEKSGEDITGILARGLVYAR